MPPLAAAIPVITTAVGAAASSVAGSAAIPLITTAVGAATSVAGGFAQSAGIRSQADNAEALGQYEQQQFEQESDTSIANAQRKMEEQKRRGQLVQSTLTARAAGSGLTPNIGSTEVLSEQSAGRNTYAALSDLAAGEDLAAGYANQGASAKYRGDLAEATAPEEEGAAILGGATSAFGTLGKFAATSLGGSSAKPYG